MGRRKRKNRRKNAVLRRILLAVMIAATAALTVTGTILLLKRNRTEGGIVHRKGPALSLVWDYRPTRFEPIGADILSPTWLYVVAGENLEPQLYDLSDMGYTFDAAAFIDGAEAAGTEVWPVVTSFEAELSAKIVAEEDSREAFADRLAEWIKACDADGLCFDFERMNPEDSDKFTDLVRRTKERLDGRKVAVAVTVPLEYDDPTNWYQCYDRGALADAADFIALMTYDAHKEAQQPTAPLPWVKRALENTLKEVPSNRILLGIPFYGVDFSVTADGETRRTAMAACTLEELLTEGTAEVNGTAVTVAVQELPVWDGEVSVTRYAFTDTEGTEHVVWMEDESSLTAKLELTESCQLAGTAVWRKSQGTPQLWRALWDYYHSEEK